MSTAYPEPSDPEDDDYDPAEEEEDDDGVMYIDQETLAEILADGEDDEEDEDELDEGSFLAIFCTERCKRELTPRSQQRNRSTHRNPQRRRCRRSRRAP